MTFVAGSIGTALLQLKETASASDHFAAAERPSAGAQTVSVESLDSLMFHGALVLLVMLVGYVMRTPVVLAEELFPTGSFFERSNLLSVLPLFLFCLLAGLGVQAAIDLLDGRGDGFGERLRVAAAIVVIVAANLGANGKARGNRQAYRSHLGKIGTLTAEQLAHARVAVGLLAKGVNILCGLRFLSFGWCRFALRAHSFRIFLNG